MHDGSSLSHHPITSLPPHPGSARKNRLRIQEYSCKATSPSRLQVASPYRMQATILRMSKRQNTKEPQEAKNDEVALDSVPPVTANERVLLAFILLIGLAVRVLYLSRTAVEHFDEGVYASNLWFGFEDDFQYPQRHFYAPPLTPWLIEWTMILTGRVSGSVAIWPSLFAGSATILGIWWLARRTFGATAAAIAGSLCAVSGTHILMSRAGLTDAGLLFWFVLAMLFCERANRTLRGADYIAFGVAVGLAWWTKYNGWLPLFLAAATLTMIYSARWLSPKVAAEQSNPSPDATVPLRELFRRQFLGLCLAGIVAIGIWSPYLWALQAHGGYSAVAANHRKYVVGLAGWWESLTRQIENVCWLSSWCNADLICLGLGMIGSGVVGHQLWRSRPRIATAYAVCLAWMWFDLLGIMTPMYTPYLRLLLPWLAGSWLLAGAGVASMVNRLRASPDRDVGGKPKHEPFVVAVLISGALMLIGVLGLAFGHVWADRTGLARVAQHIQEELETTKGSEPRFPNVVYVYGEPALYFQLRAAHIEAVSAIQTVELTPATANGMPVPTYLAIGPHAERDPDFQKLWPQVESKYELIATYSFVPSPLVLLDNHSPSELRRGKPNEAIRLFRMR